MSTILRAWLVQGGQDDASAALGKVNYALIPGLVVTTFVLTRAFFKYGHFFEEFSDWPSHIAAVSSVAAGAALPVLFDEELEFRSWVPELFRSHWTGIILLATVGTPITLRLIDLDKWWVGRFWRFAAAFCAIALTIAATSTAWASASTWDGVVRAAKSLSIDHPISLLIASIVLAYWSRWRIIFNVVRHSQLSGLREHLREDRRGAFLLAALFLLTLIALLYEVPPSLVQERGLSRNEYANAVTQERRTLLAILGAFGAGLTLVYTHLRHLLERDANATGRYTEAVQQLGSESMSIRLGGIYALSRVSRDSPSDAQTVVEVLAAFVRDGGRKSSGVGVELDVVAALTQLGSISGSRSGPEQYGQIDLSSSNFAEGQLRSVTFPVGANLRRTSFANSVLSGSSFDHADLDGATFDGADLSESSLYAVDAQGVSAVGASLRQSRASFSNLAGADLTRADLENVNLFGAILYGTDLTGANLRGVDLEGADLRGADLTDTDLTGADMRRALIYGARGLTKKMLSSCQHTDGLESAELSEEAAHTYAQWRHDRASDVQYYHPLYSWDR